MGGFFVPAGTTGRPDPALSAPDRVLRVPYRLAAFQLDKHLRARDAVETARVPGASTDEAPMVHPSCVPRGACLGTCCTPPVARQLLTRTATEASGVRFSVPLADCRLMTEPLPPASSGSSGGIDSPGTVPGSPPLVDAPHGDRGAPPSLFDSAQWWTGSLRHATSASSSRFRAAQPPLAARHATTASSSRAAQLSASCLVGYQQRPNAPEGELNFTAHRAEPARSPAQLAAAPRHGAAAETGYGRVRVGPAQELDFSAHAAWPGRKAAGGSITGTAVAAGDSGGGGEVQGDISARERALLAGTRWKAEEGGGRGERMPRRPHAVPYSERTRKLVAQVASASYGIQERRLSQRLAAHALGRPVLGLSTAERRWPSTSCYATL